MNLNTKNFAMAGGILWGISVFALTWISMSTGYGSGLVNALSSVYIGYAATAGGSIVGLIWGFLDAFIGLYIFAALYNWLQSKGR